MTQSNHVLDEPILNNSECSVSNKYETKGNISAEASRFQRTFIAVSCILAVFLNDARILYPVMVSTIITLITSTRFEPSVLIYRYILVKLIGRDPWPISEDSSGKYLLGNAAEKFIFAVMGLFLFAGLYLQSSGAGFWVVPVAIVAAGMSLAATTGICLMGVAFIQAKKLFVKK